jgi:hypothetical protein
LRSRLINFWVILPKNRGGVHDYLRLFIILLKNVFRGMIQVIIFS